MSLTHRLLLLCCLSVCWSASLASPWLRPDQVSAKQLQRSEKQYRAGQYQQAAASLKNIDTPTAQYNRGNALALSKQYKQAMQAYDQALKQNPDLEDAKHNRDIVEKLLKDPKEKQNKQEKKKKPPSKDKQKNTGKPKPQKNKKKPPAKTKPVTAKAKAAKRYLDRFLNKIPDDPGGLLKQKFLRDHQRYLDTGKTS